ncbi:flagellar biosynthesis protein FlhF [Oceanicoccus sagamiensis]|uniref:Flagellar biosynthesis protein FlhF n=1 Tax=Oceanicoccus sagamiensis TaxID=716816 RepID=A0A1X9NHW1_9GAMM|nr:flagellar biosynthesis protein FlhF [Oceanicoccus sagamiensis]ARN75425.1 flagellar biosynthesis protein FlhF [Oceanicoccus sagamiensis]
MQVKRFVAANMRLALNMVREEMGPEAVILSNKRVPDGVEILTAIDSADIAPSQSSESATAANPFQQAQDYRPQQAKPTEQKPSKLEIEVERMQNEAKARAEALAATLSEKNREMLAQAINTDQIPEAALDEVGQTSESSSFEQMMSQAVDEQIKTPEETAQPNFSQASSVNTAEQDPQLVQMRQELQSMRDLLEQQLSSMAWGQFNQQNPQQASLWKRLKRMGVGAVLADQLLAKQTRIGSEGDSGGVWQSMMTDLCQQLPTVDNDLISDGGVFAFVGPTGAGKTTTIGKLAARYVLENGADDVALVTTDTMRIAAHEQLRTFGRILNVPVSIVDKNNSLERVLYSLRHKALVLVDTAGLNRQDARLKPQLASLNEIGQRLKTVLVIPTTSQAEVIKAAYHTYKTDNLSSCVLTKLDETANLGESLNLAIDKSLPVAYSTHGQGIPDDITVANPSSLVRSAIELAKHISTDDEAMADEMSALSKNQALMATS